jgi:two-component system sensor histidine kinase RegB
MLVADVLTRGARRRIPDAAIVAVMAFDCSVLTAMLVLAGGYANPFSMIYVVNVALSAVMLRPLWAWGLLVASLAAFGTLFLFGGEHVPGLPNVDAGTVLNLHMRGMWVALAVSAALIVYIVQRVTRELEELEVELAAERSLGERRDRVASLATLAAGAAHELSTPLSTIAVVAKELQRSLSDTVPDDVRQDLQLVREQVARCREILDRMAANAGENAGEALAPIEARVWAEAALEGFPRRDRVDLESSPEASSARIVGPPRALAETLRGLVKNAVQASPPGERVTLRLDLVRGRVRAIVSDRGPGMTQEVLERVGEPFFTTKVPGEGMGLGLFLTRALAEQLGGSFHLTSRPGTGTEACFELPALDAGRRSGS